MLIAPFSLTTHTYARPVSNFLHSFVIVPSHSSPNPTKSLPFLFPTTLFSSQPADNQYSSSSSLLPLTRDGNYDEANARAFPICPGCGIHMQDFDRKQPGFFVNPLTKGPDYKKFKKEIPISDECHNLRYHGSVAHPSVENSLPDFDFDHTIGKRLMSTIGARTVVLLVMDAADFDVSFPKKMVDLVSNTIDENEQLVLVVTKIDLLPSNTSPTGLENWFRTRAREAGAGKLTGIHLVSSVREWGIKNLVDHVVDLAGERGNVWAVGAQNAGKSTLINAVAKCVGATANRLTETLLPGTTLGIVRVEGLLPGKAKLFDTPDILHLHQISTRLTDNEHKLIRIQKELKPMTYRIKAGQSVHIGGLLRLDIEESSVDSVYVTVWASPLLTLHLGNTENAGTMSEKHFGGHLKPPIGKDRFQELGEWVKKEFRVTGNWWDSSAVDIAAAGLSWFAIGLKGEAQLGVWTYEGVDVIVINALLPQRSHIFEVAGFSISEIASKPDQATTTKKL
ncbi:hypothetical protein ABFS82_04G223400 [Erythranthe guttata]